MRKVFVIDSNYPNDHYLDRADGSIAQAILKALGIRADLRLALDRECFKKAVTRATARGCDVLHISCHGDKDGIGLCNDDPDNPEAPQGYEWDEFVGLFQGKYEPPEALVMSACCGAASGLGHAFAKVEKRPSIIIGSRDKRYPADYVAAWSLLYRAFKKSGIDQEVAQEVLEAICAVVHKNFRYLRWSKERKRYLQYPGTDRLYKVSEKKI
jgi:hypothetical protein